MVFRNKFFCHKYITKIKKKLPHSVCAGRKIMVKVEIEIEGGGMRGGANLAAERETEKGNSSTSFVPRIFRIMYLLKY